MYYFYWYKVNNGDVYASYSDSKPETWDNERYCGKSLTSSAIYYWLLK
jgi:hypothetical protein